MSYSLKHLPERYARPVPPKASRWIAVLVTMLIISVIFMRIFGRYVDSKYFWLFVIGTPAALWIVSFGFRMLVWSLQDSKANGFDRQREQWILRETRRARRALQILNTTFITAHQNDDQELVAVEMLNNLSIITSQIDWKGNESQRVSRFAVDPEETTNFLIARLFSELLADLPIGQFPEKASLVVILDISSSLPFVAVREIWDQVWQESGISCAVEYVAS